MTNTKGPGNNPRPRQELEAAAAMRNVIVHRHIFKNAGTTFDYILKKNFGRGFLDHRDDVPMRRQGAPYLMKLLETSPEIKAISSHHISFRLPESSQINCIPVMFIRHPIERIRSVYLFERKQPSQTPGAIMAKKLDFSAYVSWRMDEKAPGVLRNVHTRYLSGEKLKVPLTDMHLEVALQELARLDCIGVVDMFEKSIRVFDAAFRQRGMQLDMSYKPQNVFHPLKPDHVEERAAEVLEELGALADTVLEKNRLDRIVYQAARQKLIRR